jgi:hypothetical protein
MHISGAKNTEIYVIQMKKPALLHQPEPDKQLRLGARGYCAAQNWRHDTNIRLRKDLMRYE